MKNYLNRLDCIILVYCISTLSLTCCSTQQNKNPDSEDHQENMKHSNSLIHESSPYLLQHAHNPVNWYPWGEEAWNKAKLENKLVLISIGYSSCHWCHVMERESFEDDSTAKIMNEKYVCIKVDREERPDIDQVYMTAVQLMTGSGGWPLNCFTLPDGRPIYGGTYFPNASWKDILEKLNNFYASDPEKAEQYAEDLTKGIQQTEIVHAVSEKPEFTKEILYRTVDSWKRNFDLREGGPNRAPKFPLPNNYEFLLHYGKATKDKSLSEHVELTLQKMAFGGIYDQIGGGFARYSVDSIWKVPHFEKMLYDNAQLISLYSKAYQASGNGIYADVVMQSLEWIRREMTSDEGGFYSALDADSEGEEGKFYTWTKEELEKILGTEFPLFATYYNVGGKGLWEHGNNILLRDLADDVIADNYSLSVELLRKKITNSGEKLLAIRDKRIHPGLDDKQLTSWNSLMIKGYCDAYAAFGKPEYLAAAIKNAELLLSKFTRPDQGLNHSYKSGKSSINGYLEDYSFTIEAFIALYQVTFNEFWLLKAKSFADYTLKHFYDEQTGMFWFTSNLDPPLIARKKEISDNVVPASNSSLAKGLFTLGTYYEDIHYTEVAQKMTQGALKELERYGSGYSNWALLVMQFTFPTNEVVITGNNSEVLRKEMMQHYLPNVVFAGSKTEQSNLPLLEKRLVEGKTYIYVCTNKSCRLPVESVTEALNQIR